MRQRIFSVLFCSFIAATASHAPVVVAQQDPQANATSVTIDAPGGIVEWRNVARGIASAENLDEDAVASLFPPGTLNLNSAGAQLMVGGLSLGLGRGINLAIERDGNTASALRIDFDRNALRASLNVLRGIARQIVFRWGNDQDSRYGLFLDEDWQRHTTERPLVVIVHGYNSRPEEFDTLRGRLRDAGFGCAVFSYPNDAAVAFSGRQLASALQAFERQNPGRRVALVAHSMGGLLSRVVIEDPDTASVGNIDQLIMVATPNHGSNLARVPVSQDVWQNWLDGEPDTVKTVFFDSVVDGLNEARFDLQPESELLQRLNSLPRNPNVRYSLILGDKGPATREQLDELRRLILATRDRNVALRALGPRLEGLLEDLDELVDGLGDGAVAVERGRLEGVDDTIVLHNNHGAITSALTDENSNRLVAEIVSRLDRRQAI